MYLIANTPVGVEKKWPEIKAPLSRLQSNSKAWTAAMNVLTAELHNSRSSVLTVIHVNERDRNISAAAGALLWGHSLFPRFVLITPVLILTTNLQLSTQF